MTISAVNGGSGPLYARLPRTPPTMTNTAQLLGLSTSQLSQNLQSGSTLSSLASKQGVSSTSLINSITSDLKANAPRGASGVSSRQLTQIATNIANGTAKPAGSPDGQGGTSLGGVGSARAQSNLSTLAAAMGLDPSTLLARLTSGQSLSSLLSAGGKAGYGTSVASAATGGVMVDQYA